MTERKCPSCGSYAATIDGGTSTLLGWTPKFDENGEYEFNDPNIYTTNYTCTKCGQKYRETIRGEERIIIAEVENITAKTLNDISITGSLDLTAIDNSSSLIYSNSVFLAANQLKTYINIDNLSQFIIQYDNVNYTINGAKLFELLEKYNILEKET